MKSTKKSYRNLYCLINYVKNLGYVLIRKVELEIGGIVLSREYGEWLYIWNELITPYEQKKGVDVILGNTETCTASRAG